MDQSYNYYMNNPMFNRTKKDLDDINQFYSNNTNYGPNPVSSEKQVTSVGSYKSLRKAYNADIKNDCVNRWDNDYQSWSNKMNKSTEDDEWYRAPHFPKK